MDEARGKGLLTVFLTTFLTNLALMRIFSSQNLHQKEKTHTFVVCYLGSTL